MSPTLRPSSGPSGEPPPRTMYVSGGGNSLLEFRSESDENLDDLIEAEAPSPGFGARLRTLLADRRALPLILLVAALLTGALTGAYLWTRGASADGTGPTSAAASQPGGSAAAAASAADAAAPAPPPAPTTGTLDIASDPPGARVIVDGTARGVTPVSVPDIAPGAHEISIIAGATTINRSVRVTAGTTATVLASVVPARAGAGWVAIEMPFETEIIENGRTLGTTSSPRLALPAGWHELELRNAALGFQASLSVQIVPGQVSRPSLTTPTGLISINAIPWANVVIDGQDAGTTPLANIAVPIGPHEVVFTHPRLGERRQTVTVTGGEPVRIGVTFGQ